MTNPASDMGQFARSILPGSIVLIAILLQITPESASSFAQLYPLSPSIGLPLAVIAAYVLGQVVGCFSFDLMHQLIYSRLLDYDGRKWHFGKYSDLKEKGFRRHLLDLCRVGNNSEIRDFLERRYGILNLNYRDLYSLLNYCRTASATKSPDAGKRLDKYEARIQIPFATFLPLVALAFSATFSPISKLFPGAVPLSWILVGLWLLFIVRSYYDRVDEARTTLWTYYHLFGESEFRDDSTLGPIAKELGADIPVDAAPPKSGHKPLLVNDIRE